MLTKDIIKLCINKVTGVHLVNDVIINENFFSCRICVDAGIKGILEWDVEIYSLYPFKSFGHESISFKNPTLLEYPHIMEGGVLCMHTSVYDDAEIQLIYDLEQLKEWVKDYYINEKKDSHYEHLVVNHITNRGEFNCFFFAETESVFENDDFGVMSYTPLLNGVKDGIIVNNWLVQYFKSYIHKKTDNWCKISSTYKHLQSFIGLYCILSESPSSYNKFIINDYQAIEQLFTKQQKDFIAKIIFNWTGQNLRVPLFCGYKIQNGEIHWQTMVLYTNNLPIDFAYLNVTRTPLFKQGSIEWGITENISYNYFFGRGAMPLNLAKKRMLIIGVGAVGSILAETLTRCGAKNLTLYDFDAKEPGNVCRSSYNFYTGISEKTLNLVDILCGISPHLECHILPTNFDLIIKSTAAKGENKSYLIKLLNNYDIIFDCTTDNQLMQFVDTIGISSIVVNVSITNYAQDLVCVFSPNVVKTVSFIYGILNRNSDKDLYNPTGCWSPTFKASYNDISCLVQFAIGHIIKMLSKTEAQTSFYITNENDNLKMYRI